MHFSSPILLLTNSRIIWPGLFVCYQELLVHLTTQFPPKLLLTLSVVGKVWIQLDLIK